MFEALNRWLVQQIPPVVLLALAVIGWAGFLLFTPKKLTTLEAQQVRLAAQVSTRDSLMDRRVSAVERITTNLVKDVCWKSDEERRMWLGCNEVLGNQVPGRRP